MDLQTLSKINHALPAQFPFYHLGQVEILPQNPQLADFLNNPEESAAIGFRLEGDLRTLIVLLFDRALDRSTYTELGNILASQLATELAKSQDLDLMISPPIEISAALLRELLSGRRPMVHRAYAHQLERGNGQGSKDRNGGGESQIFLDMLVVPTQEGSVGNA